MALPVGTLKEALAGSFCSDGCRVNMCKAGKVFVPNTLAFKDSQNPEGVPRERVLMHLQISAEHPADEDVDRKSRLFLSTGFIMPFIAEELRIGSSSRSRETNWMDAGRSSELLSPALCFLFSAEL